RCVMDRRLPVQNTRFIFFVLIVGLTLCTGGSCIWGYWVLSESETKITDQRPKQAEDEIADDRIEDKAMPLFDPELVDRRPLGDSRLNLSAAVVHLRMPPIRRESEADLITLHPSYAAAVAAAPQ